jgi:hypothetical protein
MMNHSSNPALTCLPQTLRLANDGASHAHCRALMHESRSFGRRRNLGMVFDVKSGMIQATLKSSASVIWLSIPTKTKSRR